MTPEDMDKIRRAAKKLAAMAAREPKTSAPGERTEPPDSVDVIREAEALIGRVE
jgi:hypothetical protein